MDCPFCSATVEEAMADYIAVIDGDCPSGCDDSFILHIDCPYCGRPLFRKTVMQSYVTRWKEEFPPFVKILDELPHDWGTVDTDEDFFLEVNDGEIWLHKRIIGTATSKPILKIFPRPAGSR